MYRLIHAVAALVIMGGTAAAATPHWTIKYVGAYKTQSSYNTILALSSTSVWAAGEYGTSPFCCTDALISHWDGKRWSSPPLPAGFTKSSGGNAGDVYDLAGSAAGNVWALADGAANGDTYTLWWNGQRWSVQHNWGTSRLTALAVLAPDNVWAADSTDYLKGAWHFDGKSWKVVRAPLIIDQFATLSATDIWAEGFIFDSSNFPRPRVAHWNGRAWSIVPSPSIPSGTAPLSATFTAIAAASDHDVWITGYITTASGSLRGVAIHWNGAHWTRNDPAALHQSAFVVPDAAGGAWAGDGSSLVRYTGGKWTTVMLPAPSGKSSAVAAISRIPRTSTAWAAGALLGPFPKAGPISQQAEILTN